MIGSCSLQAGKLAIELWYDFGRYNGEKVLGLTWYPGTWVGVSLLFIGVCFKWRI